PETHDLVIGGLLVGTGTAWYDSLSIEVKEIEKPGPIVVGGHVLDGAHKPVAGAVVSLSDQASMLEHVTSDASGAFSFHATTGMVGVWAIHEPHVAAFLPPEERRADVSNLEIVLGDRDGETLHVKVTSGTPIPAGTVATVSNVSNFEGDLWAVPVVD